MESAMFEFERLPDEGFVIRVNPRLPHLLPAESRSHFRAARKEMLLALRGFLDAAIEGLDKAEEAKGKGRVKIPVE